VAFHNRYCQIIFSAHPLEIHCPVLFSFASVLFPVTEASTTAFPPEAGAGNFAHQLINPYLKRTLAVVAMSNMGTFSTTQNQSW